MALSFCPQSAALPSLFLIEESGPVITCCLTKRALDAGESARFSSSFSASAVFSSDGVPPPAPSQVTQTVSLLIDKTSKLMVKQFIIAVLASLILVSCGTQDLTALQTPVTEMPLIISTETATLRDEKSATPFPDQKSLKVITEDGKWEISLLLGPESTLQVTSVDGKIKWILDRTTLPDISLGQLWNYKTANDGNSLYFALGSYYSETIVSNRYPPNYGLFKLNLANGEVETILKPHIDSSGYASCGYFALSPDELQIIYSWWDAPTIIVRNLATLDEQVISLPDNYKIAGAFVWSPNGKYVLFTMWDDIWDYPTDFEVTRLDLDDKSIQSLYLGNEENSFFVPTEWAEEDLVYLVDHRTNEPWQINPFTGQLQERISTTP